MRYLSLLRHANAPASKPDKKRILDEKGINQARQVGVYLSRQPQIDLIKLSDATRTKQTFNQLIKTLGYTPESQETLSLYNVTPEQILKEILETNDNVSNLMIIGHNPSIMMVAQLLNINIEAKWISSIFESHPAAKVTVIKSEADSWQSFTKFNNQIVDIYWPEQ
jgi:phosphohistidine phosphatase